MAKGLRRNVQRESHWRKVLERQADSGQSVRAWCRGHRVAESGLYYWRGELARRDAELNSAATAQTATVTDSSAVTATQTTTAAETAGATTSASARAATVSATSTSSLSSSPTLVSAAFVPVAITGDRGVGRIEIMLGDGRSVRLTGRVDRRALADVVAVLTSAIAVEPEARAC